MTTGPPLRAASCPRSARATRRRRSRGGRRGRRGRTAPAPRRCRRRRRPSCPAPSATASATARVPAANGSSSNAPIGPFQKTVPASAITSRVARRGAGADVEPHPAVGHVDAVELAALGVGRERAPGTRSVGQQQLAAAPRRARACAGSMPSSSHSESPTSWPCAEKNGKHIAPPMRTVSARSRNASRTPILSVTFAPPTIATSGRFGSSRIPVSVSTSRCSSSPAALGSRLRDADGRGVRAVRGAERVVDVDVGEARRSAWRARGRSSSRPARSGRSRASRRRRRGTSVEVDSARARRRLRRAARRAARRRAAARAPARGPSAGRGARRARARAPRSRSALERRQRGADARVVGDARAVRRAGR